MRNLRTLLEDVALIVPEKYKNRFDSIQESAKCSAPENMQLFWNEGSQTIADVCLNSNGVPEYKWQVEVLSLWSTQSTNTICDTCNLVYENLL